MNNLRCADDVVLITTTLIELQELLNRVADYGKKYGLVINKGKTNVMALSSIYGDVLHSSISWL